MKSKKSRGYALWRRVAQRYGSLCRPPRHELQFCIGKLVNIDAAEYTRHHGLDCGFER
jgi:hypothetical protein